MLGRLFCADTPRNISCVSKHLKHRMMILILPVHSGSFIHGVHCGGFFFSPQFGYRLHQRGYVLTRVRLFAGWSIYSRITQKLLKRFPTNIDGGSVSATEKTPLTFGVNPDKGTYPGCFFSPYLTFLGDWYIWGRRLDLTRLFSLSFSCSSRFVWLRNQQYISTGCDAKRVYSYIHIFKFYSGVMM